MREHVLRKTIYSLSDLKVRKTAAQFQTHQTHSSGWCNGFNSNTRSFTVPMPSHRGIQPFTSLKLNDAYTWL